MNHETFSVLNKKISAVVPKCGFAKYAFCHNSTSAQASDQPVCVSWIQVQTSSLCEIKTASDSFIHHYKSWSVKLKHMKWLPECKTSLQGGIQKEKCKLLHPPFIQF